MGGLVTGVRLDSATPDRDPATPDRELGAADIELLECVRRTAMALLAELPHGPRRLRIEARHIVMELDWVTTVPPDLGLSAPPARESNASERGAAAGDQADGTIRITITAPIVGTFYRRPKPDSAPFVEVGSQVQPGQQVAIVETMKLMLPVEASAAGVIAEVLVADGEPVEYGQALFSLD
jgi:acetyl-CoA carboxylase biotin carboxyl carrier protein